SDPAAWGRRSDRATGYVLVARQKDRVVAVKRRGDNAATRERGRAGLGGEDVVTLHADERVLLEGDVAVAVQHVLAVLVAVVGVALLHIAGGRGGGDGLDVVVVAAVVAVLRRAGVDIRSNRE